MRILVLDGVPERCRAVAARLRADGHAVDAVRTLRDARSALLDVDYDALLLSRVVADGDVLAQVADLRAAGLRRPILVVATEAGPEARLAALDAGADDTVSVPVSLDELVLRVRKVLLRAVEDGSPTDGGDERLGRVTLARSRREVTVDGVPIDLTPTQYAILEVLLTARGRAVPASELLERCWDRNRRSSKPLPAQISRLRRALGDVLEIEWTRDQGYVVREAEHEG